MGDLLIRGGLVADGTGAPAFPADVLVREDRIAAVGPGLPGENAQVIEAAGKLVTPGFINMHSHADCSAAMYPNMESTLGQGITTDFAGHCGLGVAPVNPWWLYMFPEKRAFTRVMPEPVGGINPYDAYIIPTDALRAPFEEVYGEKLDWSSWGEFRAHLDRVGTGANFALVLGQAPLRLQAMGLDYRRPATKEEIAAMTAVLEEVMDAGALGLGLGLDYEPGLFASREELVALMTVVARRGGIVTAHTRSRSHSYYGHTQNFLDGLKEFLALGLETGARVHVSHIQNAFPVTPEDDAMGRAGALRTLEVVEEYRQKGVRATWDVIPKYAFGPFHYPMAASMFEPYVSACGGCAGFSQMLTVGSYRSHLSEEIRNGGHPSKGIFTRFNPKADPDWDTRQRFTRCADTSVVGLTIREAADGGDSLEKLLDLLTLDPYTAVISLGRQPDHTPDRDGFVSSPEATIGLDTWTFDYAARLTEGDAPLECGSPATYHGMARFFAQQRALGVPVEETVKKLTGNPAAILGLSDRGLIRNGYAADLLVLDQAAFDAPAMPDALADPRQGCPGLDAVVVNGALAVDRGLHTHVRSGRVL